MCVYDQFPEFEMTALKDFSKSARETAFGIGTGLNPNLIRKELRNDAKL